MLERIDPTSLHMTFDVCKSLAQGLHIWIKAHEYKAVPGRNPIGWKAMRRLIKTAYGRVGNGKQLSRVIIGPSMVGALDTL